MYSVKVDNRKLKKNKNICIVIEIYILLILDSSFSDFAVDGRDKINCEPTIASSSSVDFVLNNERLKMNFPLFFLSETKY